MNPFLFLDLSSNSGVAVGPPDGDPRLSRIRLPVTGDDVGAYLSAYDKALNALLDKEAPIRLGFEAPILPKRTTKATARKLMSLAGHTEFVCFRRGIDCSEINVSTLKKWFAGHGRAEKVDMIAAARRHGWSPADDNEADAAAGWAHMVHVFAPAYAERFRMGAMGAGR